MTKKRLSLGKWGEDRAARFLVRKQKFKILERNYRCPLGEVDLVARCRDMLVFVEVKTKKSDDYLSPLYSVTRKKQRQVIRTAQYYLKQHHLPEQNCRFDVVAVVAGEGGKPEKVEHYPGAFRL